MIPTKGLKTSISIEWASKRNLSDKMERRAMYISSQRHGIYSGKALKVNYNDAGGREDIFSRINHKKR